MDPNNPIIQLCAAGMKAEASGDLAEASRLFQQAWEESRDDFEATIAAHYVARHQPNARETLRWNQLSLERAEKAEPEKVRSFYPSLYLNLGKSQEDLGQRDEAARFYELALAQVGTLPPGPYGDAVRDAIQRGLHRVK
jgi:tetratricopeptide (TPR) repeat protein